jgi:hypothetical protein
MIKAALTSDKSASRKLALSIRHQQDFCAAIDDAAAAHPRSYYRLLVLDSELLLAVPLKLHP